MTGGFFSPIPSERYDVIDLSLADSAGLSSPGGFAIVEKFSYTREAMASYMRALKDGGVLSVTLWNKEEPPKSVLKLYTTMAAAAREVEDGDIANRFFVVSSYLSTATVLYKRGGFSAEEIGKLSTHTRAMSFDAIYYPGFEYDPSQTAKVLDDYRQQIFVRDRFRCRPKDEPTPEAMPPAQAPPTRRSPRQRSGSRGSRDRHGPAGLASSRARRLGRYRRPLRVRHPAAHQRRGLTSPPMSNPATLRW